METERTVTPARSLTPTQRRVIVDALARAIVRELDRREQQQQQQQRSTAVDHDEGRPKHVAGEK